MHVPLTTDLIYHEQYTILNYQYFDNLRNLIVAAKLKKNVSDTSIFSLCIIHVYFLIFATSTFKKDKSLLSL